MAEFFNLAGHIGLAVFAGLFVVVGGWAAYLLYIIYFTKD